MQPCCNYDADGLRTVAACRNRWHESNASVDLRAPNCRASIHCTLSFERMSRLSWDGRYVINNTTGFAKIMATKV